MKRNSCIPRATTRDRTSSTWPMEPLPTTIVPVVAPVSANVNHLSSLHSIWHEYREHRSLIINKYVRLRSLTSMQIDSNPSLSVSHSVELATGSSEPFATIGGLHDGTARIPSADLIGENRWNGTLHLGNQSDQRRGKRNGKTDMEYIRSPDLRCLLCWSLGRTA